MVKQEIKYLVGIDEAGRGPLAGPVAVGAVAMSSLPVGRQGSVLDSRVRDSKQLSAKQRDEWYQWLKNQQKQKKLKFAVALVSEKVIDKIGINKPIMLGINRCIIKLKIQSSKAKILLDGGLKAPEEFKNQKTIIKGDEKESVIALASIAAKVTRDRKMLTLHKHYPAYDFARHKGYGTAAHYLALKTHGPCPHHPRTFIKNL